MDPLVLSFLSFTVSSAHTTWHCGESSGTAKAFNCSYNGRCSPSGACECETAWRGIYCHKLNLLPATNASGLNQLRGSGATKTSTWGGSVLWDAPTKKYHMYASEISRHCGIHRWITNSIVVHATSAGASENWHFTRRDEITGLFSHEPIVARAPPPGNEFVLYYTHYPGDGSDSPTCNCSDGSSASGGCAGEAGGGKNKSLYSYFSSSLSPGGPWSDRVSLSGVQPNPHCDMNLAPVIRANGSMLAWNRWDVIICEKWNDPSTCKDMGQAPDFSHGSMWEGEDPSLWVDAEGFYHMVSHNGARGQDFRPHNESGDCVRHYFSTRGAAGTWNVANGGLPAADLGGCAAAHNDVPFEVTTTAADGRTTTKTIENYTFYRRERPHIILGPDGFTPVALSTAVIDSPGCPGSPIPGLTGQTYTDASYTLVQPIVTDGGAAFVVPQSFADKCAIALVRQLGTAACTRGSTYDCSNSGSMWTAGNCAGLFNCNDVDNIDCDSRGAPSGNKSCACGSPEPPHPGPAPSPPRGNRTSIPMPHTQQISAIGFELEMFLHFSIDTFTSALDPTLFAPNAATLNVSQWVSVAKSMGARVAALTSKHEKGFCLWPSKFSNFTIAHSPTVGDRDLVQEFVTACRAQGIKPGLYFTTTDTYNKDNPNKAQIQLDQMTELTTLYGDDIAYFWFDHHAAPTWDSIDDIVRKNQPQCAMLGPDCWLTGQETGFSEYPMWHGVDTTDNTTHGRPVTADATNGNPHGVWFKVWESDCSNYKGCHPWFFGGDTPQSLELMMEHWESSYGRGQNYILNLPPSKDGIITPKMAAAAAAFGVERHRRYGPGSSAPDTKSECELARGSGRMAQWGSSVPAGARDAQLLEVSGPFDRIFISEDVIHDGQLVAQYVVETCDTVVTRDGGEGVVGTGPGCGEKEWTRVVGPNMSKYGGVTIGTHHIDLLNVSLTARTKFARLRLLEVLPAPTLPMISFRVLHVGAS